MLEAIPVRLQILLALIEKVPEGHALPSDDRLIAQTDTLAAYVLRGYKPDSD